MEKGYYWAHWKTNNKWMVVRVDGPYDQSGKVDVSCCGSDEGCAIEEFDKFVRIHAPDGGAEETFP